MLMKLPVRFPTEADVIADEVARFRALSPAEPIRAIHGLLSAGALLLHQSPKATFLREETLAQEALARQAIKEFLSRHGSNA